VQLVNALYVKNVPVRAKNGQARRRSWRPADRNGLLRPSFVPPTATPSTCATHPLRPLSPSTGPAGAAAGESPCSNTPGQACRRWHYIIGVSRAASFEGIDRRSAGSCEGARRLALGRMQTVKRAALIECRLVGRLTTTNRRTRPDALGQDPRASPPRSDTLTPASNRLLAAMPRHSPVDPLLGGKMGGATAQPHGYPRSA